MTISNVFHKCSICPRQFQSIEDADDHFEKIHKCAFCKSLIFENIAQKNHHDHYNHRKCIACNVYFEDTIQFRTHLIMHQHYPMIRHRHEDVSFFDNAGIPLNYDRYKAQNGKEYFRCNFCLKREDKIIALIYC